jgi:hypothetical protein
MPSVFAVFRFNPGTFLPRVLFDVGGVFADRRAKNPLSCAVGFRLRFVAHSLLNCVGKSALSVSIRER